MPSVAEPVESVRAWERHLGREVDPAALRAELVEGSLTEAFHRTAAEAPERVALQIGETTITHGELDAAAARLGGWMRDRGVRPGDRVLVTGRTSVELVLAYLGVLRAGAAMVPADPGSTASELAHLIADSGAVGGVGGRASARPRPALRRRARRRARGRGRAAGAGERLGRSRDGRLHVGDHRSAEGRRAQPRQRARLAARRHGRVALAP